MLSTTVLDALSRGFNRASERVLGTYEDGDRKVWAHWQNLNERGEGPAKFVGSAFRHGRAWIHAGRRANLVIHTEWHLGQLHQLDLGLSFDESDREVLLHFTVPGVSLFFGVEGIGSQWFWNKVNGGSPGYGGRRFGVRFSDWKIWWSFWEREMEWRATDPKWQRFTIDIPDIVLGKAKYNREELGDPVIIHIPMPEGEYRARAHFIRHTKKRPRWFRRVSDSTSVDVLTWGGIPHEGKGENSWDCGTDGLYGYGADGHDLGQAIARGTEIVLRDRLRYDRSLRAVYPSPIVTERERILAFAKYVRSFPMDQRNIRIEQDGDLVIITHLREGRDQCITVRKDAMEAHWPGVVEELEKTSS